MLKFFRSIRKKLIEQDNLRKYLLYAIGEILLVVIGILIAVQINSWNQDRVNRSKEFEYLKGIHSDLNRQIESLNRTIEINERSISIVHGLLEEYIRLDGFERNDSIFSRINTINRSASPTGIKTTFSELMYGAEIPLIRDERLRNEIVLFYQELDAMIGRSRNNSEVIFQSQLHPIFTNRTIVDLEQFNNVAFDFNLNLHPLSNPYSARTKELAFKNLEDPEMQLEFINALNMKAIIEGLQRERSKLIIASAEQLKSRIEKEVQEEHRNELNSATFDL
ncbi:MAG: DUF6090 family protein [Cyclonatronaceae bacterium]